jgi:hypothetical protein
LRSEDQMELQMLLAGMDYQEIQAEMPSVSAVAGRAQGTTASADAPPRQSTWHTWLMSPPSLVFGPQTDHMRRHLQVTCGH